MQIGIDTMVFALAKRYLDPPLWHEVFRYTYPPDGKPDGLAIDAGPLGDQLISGLHHVVAALARAGNNVIVDHVLLEPHWVQECASILGDLPALLVGVYCPLEVVEQRERDRQDRTVGQARAQFDKVHAHRVYDVSVDTSKATAEECAAVILKHIHAQTLSAALAQLQTANGT
jgi:chloramphenicol 3-O-phosphotransferase